MWPVDSEAQDKLMFDSQGLLSTKFLELARQLQEAGQETFRKNFDCAFLVLKHGPPCIGDWIELDTSSEARVPNLPKDRSPLIGVKSIPLRKSDRSASGSTITLGRARNNDVIIRAPNISKLHASFYLDGKGGYSLQDIGSLNGTVVNGERLNKSQRVRLKNGATISFWRYIFEFITLDELIDRITVG